MKQSGLAPILIVTLIAVLAVGGYFWFNYSNNQTGIIPKPSPGPADETANWKTYANTEYNLSLNYPNDLQIKENDFGVHKSIIFSNEYKPPFSNYFNFGLIIHTVKGEINLKTWLEDYIIQNLPSGKRGSIVLEDIMPYKNDKIEGFYFIGGKESVNKYIIFKNDNYIYEIVLSGSGTGASYTENPNAEKLLDQILSTFKFIH